jgi:hypothetical protein
VNEHDYEPIPGLPAPLPADETILWQGAPAWESLARRAMRVRLVALYFAVLIVWGIAAGLSEGTPVGSLALSSSRLLGLGAVAVALLSGFAWLVARTTLYTITSRRVVMRFGIALPLTLQIPFVKIDSASLQTWADRAGDIALALPRTERAAYLMIWPHARPWRVLRAQPSLRSIPDAASVAQILGRALAASASQAPQAVPAQVGEMAASGSPIPATA